MKLKILTFVTICVAFIGNICIGQKAQQSGNNFTINSPTAGFVNSIIGQTSSLGANTPASAAALTGKRIMWLEYGDGGFTTDKNTTRSLSTLPSDNWFFVSARLYDGERDRFRITAGSPFLNRPGRPNNPLDNDNAKLTGSNKILITPNTYDIISDDTMCFAVSYRLKTNSDSCYYLVFNYNSNSSNVFLPIAGGLDPTATSMSVINSLTAATYSNIKYARTFHNETYLDPIPTATQYPTLIPNIKSAIPSGNSYTNTVIMKISCDETQTLLERNMFFSLVSQGNLVIDNMTNINASIVATLNSSGNAASLVDQHTLAGMAIRPSHDPNYIVQSPVCLQLPKAPRLFDYHLHFQNTGPGKADIVKITLQFTPGFDLSTFNINRARFSDENYYNNIHNGITYTTNPARNQVELTMDLRGNRNLNNELLGTHAVSNPWSNPETMGDIYFEMLSTASAQYNITAQAFIDFHSSSRRPDIWESTVATNTAVSTYSNCCNCDIFNCGNAIDSTIRIKKPVPIKKSK